MSSTLCLYISQEQKVYKIPKPKNHMYKPVKELAGQEVLKILLYYDTAERKPSNLNHIEYERITLDSEGVHQIKGKRISSEMYNFFAFGLATAEELADRESPPVIPRAPVVLKSDEKKALYNYLQKSYKSLFADAPFILEARITTLNEKYKEHLELLKLSQKLMK
ncbi:hypothetical protein YSY43_17820 [Paenibacillus sp. YSY-4.3]